MCRNALKDGQDSETPFKREGQFATHTDSLINEARKSLERQICRHQTQVTQEREGAEGDI